MKEPIRAENPVQNDFTVVLKGTRIATIAVDAVLISPAAAHRPLSDTHMQDPEILLGCLCRVATI
jgi:hypothetical protein